MARQVIIHAGFHKTGTTSVQATLQANGKAIWPTHALVLPKRINDVTRMATLHSVMQGPMTLEEFKSRLTTFLAGLQVGKKRGLILSAENLAGLMPGRKDNPGYETCPVLMAATQACLHKVWGDDLEITFVFGLRDRDDWVRSTYWQNLRSSRLTKSFEEFAASLAGLDLNAVADGVRAAVKGAEVRTMRLEETRDMPLGPATPILEMAQLRPELRNGLVGKPAANLSPGADVIAACLALNRSPGSDAEIAERKEALLRSIPPVSKAARIA